MCNRNSICLVLLIGIPSSGKSFFRTYLENYLEGNFDSILGSVFMCSVSYDNYEKVRHPQQFVDETSWKEERSKVFDLVKRIISFFMDSSSCETMDKCFPNVTLTNSSCNKPDCTLILIDDNMYYRSMRYEYFKLAKENKVSFCQIYFDITLEKALTSNNERSFKSQVPEFVIKSMFGKIEPPATNAWENNSICIPCYTDFENAYALNSILYLLKNSLLNPLSYDSETNLQREMARQITNSNTLHQIDNILKQYIGEIIKKEIKELNNKNPQRTKFFSTKRLNLLRQIKNGNVILPIDMRNQFQDEDINLIKPILFDLLETACNEK